MLLKLKRFQLNFKNYILNFWNTFYHSLFFIIQKHTDNFIFRTNVLVRLLSPTYVQCTSTCNTYPKTDHFLMIIGALPRLNQNAIHPIKLSHVGLLFQNNGCRHFVSPSLSPGNLLKDTVVQETI